MTRNLMLTNGMVAIIDTQDFYACFKYWPWHLGSGRYARATVDGRRKSLTYIYLHQFIAERMGLNGQIDHRDRDKLNNQRENLRIATDSQNNTNIATRSDNTSGFKGVSWDRARSKWVVRITTNTGYKSIGGFDCKITAARAYNEAAKKAFGEFAYLNIIPEETK